MRKTGTLSQGWDPGGSVCHYHNAYWICWLNCEDITSQQAKCLNKWLLHKMILNASWICFQGFSQTGQAKTRICCINDIRIWEMPTEEKIPIGQAHKTLRRLIWQFPLKSVICTIYLLPLDMNGTVCTRIYEYIYIYTRVNINHHIHLYIMYIYIYICICASCIT